MLTGIFRSCEREERNRQANRCEQSVAGDTASVVDQQRAPRRGFHLGFTEPMAFYNELSARHHLLAHWYEYGLPVLGASMLRGIGGLRDEIEILYVY
jgi:hypothetical protein